MITMVTIVTKDTIVTNLMVTSVGVAHKFSEWLPTIRHISMSKNGFCRLVIISFYFIVTFIAGSQRTESTRDDGRPQSHVCQNNGRRAQPYLSTCDLLALVCVRIVHFVEKCS